MTQDVVVAGPVDWVRRWWAAEAVRLRAEDSRVHAVLWWLWARPWVVIPFAAVVYGAVGSWSETSDAILFRKAAVGILDGGLWDVFADPILQIGPLYLLLTAAVVAVTSVLHLPVAFVMPAVETALVLWLAFVTVGRAAAYGKVSPTPGRWACVAALVVSGLLGETFLMGHPEEVALGLALVIAALDARAGRWRAASVLVGVATGVKLWALLGAPVLALQRRWSRVVLAGTCTGLVVLALYGPFFLLGEVRTFEFSWPASPNSTIGLLAEHGYASGWSLRLVQGAAVAVVGLLVARRRDAHPVVVVAAVVATRLLLDPMRLTYYMDPVVLVMVVWAWTSGAAGARRLRWPVLASVPLVVLGPYFVQGVPQVVASTVLLLAAPLTAVLVERHAARDTLRLREGASPTLGG